MIKSKKVTILYHDNCVDGFTAAWVASLAVKKNGLEHVTSYKAVNYNQNWNEMGIPALCCDADVFVLDFSFPREYMLHLRDISRSIEVHDHHITSQKDCEGLDFCFFDNTKSGAMLAWERFFPDNGGLPGPMKIVKYVQDYDLWKFELEDSEEINAYIHCMEKTFPNWEKLASELNMHSDKPIYYGKGILQLMAHQIQAAIKYPILVNIDGHFVYAINLSTSNLISKTVGALAKLEPESFAASFFMRQDGKWIFSLRSTDKGIDVGEIAKRQGGGGHKNAAGFESSNLLSFLVACEKPNCRSNACIKTITNDGVNYYCKSHS